MAQVSSPMADTVSISLEEAITRAVQVSPDVLVVAADRDFAAARSRLARSSRFLTEFEATTAHAVAPGLTRPNPEVPTDQLYLDPDVRNDFNNLSPYTQVEVELLQPIYTWGELGGNIRAARYGVELEEAALETQEHEVALRAAELYYNVLLTNDLLHLAEETENILEQAKGEINKLLEEGSPDVDDADLFKVQLTEQEFKRRFVEIQQRRQTAQVALRRQLFLPEGTTLVPQDNVLQPLAFEPDPLEHYFALAQANRPELAQALAGRAARDALVRVARSDFFPKFFFGYSTTIRYAAGRFRQPNPYVGDQFRGQSVRVGFGFRQKLNFFQTRARLDQARAERAQVQHQLDGAQQLILFEVEDAYRSLLIARAALDAQHESLRISNEWLRTEQVNFDLDLGDTENLIDAVQANLELQARQAEALQQYNLAVLTLLKAAGILVEQVESGTLVD